MLISRSRGMKGIGEKMSYLVVAGKQYHRLALQCLTPEIGTVAVNSSYHWRALLIAAKTCEEGAL